MPSRQRDDGFSLLEAIVALSILAASAVALLAWLNGGMTTLARAQAVTAQIRAQRLVLEDARAINPMATPRGERRIGALAYTWAAQPTGPATTSVGWPSADGLFLVQLFDCTLSVVAGEPFEIRTQLMGYQRRAIDPVAP
jgi:general secretion pathway protein I